jgi:hypothetical protein
MPGVGIGGLVSNWLNPGLDDTIAKQVTPNPSPLAQQGQGQPSGQGGTGTADQAGNPFARAQVTQQDPVAATLAENLVHAQRQSMLAADLNRNIAGMAAGFGTAQQQASKQAALAGMPGGADEIGMWQGIQGINKEQTAQNEHARFMGNMAVFAQSLSTALGRPVSVQEATEWANSPEMMDSISKAVGANQTFTGNTKDADQAARSFADANPKATPEQIAAYRSSVLAMGSGVTMEDQAYRAYAQGEIAAGRTPDDIVTWKNKHTTEAKTEETHAVDVTKERDAAVIEYPAIDETLRRSEEAIKGLLANKEALLKAIRTPDFFERGKWAVNLPAFMTASDDTKAAAALLDQLNNSLAGEALKGAKNVRNIQEFNALSGAYTAGLRPGNTDKGIIDTLNSLQERIDRMRSVAREQAGLPPLDKGSGGDSSQAAPPAGGGGKGNPLPESSDAAVRKKIADSPGEKDAVIKHFEGLGFDMSKYK